jgi:hypothetical protein
MKMGSPTPLISVRSDGLIGTTSSATASWPEQGASGPISQSSTTSLGELKLEKLKDLYRDRSLPEPGEW